MAFGEIKCNKSDFRFLPPVTLKAHPFSERKKNTSSVKKLETFNIYTGTCLCATKPSHYKYSTYLILFRPRWSS